MRVKLAAACLTGNLAVTSALLSSARFEEARVSRLALYKSKVIEAYRQAIKIRPDLDRAHHHLGHALSAQKKLDEGEPSES